MACTNPSRLYHPYCINLLCWSLKHTVVWSELGPAPPFPPMRVFKVQWSRNLSLICEVALRDLFTHVQDINVFFIRDSNLQGSSDSHDARLRVTYKVRLTLKWRIVIIHAGGNMGVISLFTIYHWTLFCHLHLAADILSDSNVNVFLIYFTSYNEVNCGIAVRLWRVLVSHRHWTATMLWTIQKWKSLTFL